MEIINGICQLTEKTANWVSINRSNYVLVAGIKFLKKFEDENKTH